MSQDNSHQPLDAASLAYAHGFVAEDAPLLAAREAADGLGCTPIGTGAGAVLRMLASLIDAHNVVEVGTGTGVSTLWLLRGMSPDGVLTSIDVDVEHQRAARATLAAAGEPHARFRLIAGRALDVLPRLTDGAYDLVFVDADKSEYPAYVEQALRLLRPGGVLVLDNALWDGKVADPAQRDTQTVALRDLGRELAADERLVSALLPVGDGLLVGVLHTPGE